MDGMLSTNQMMARTAAKTGIPLQQNTLLDIMNKQSNSVGNMISPTGNTNSFLQKLKDRKSVV